MYIVNTIEESYQISNYPNYDLSDTKYIVVKLVNSDSNSYVGLELDFSNIILSESMIDDLIEALKAAGVFLRQDPP